MPTYVAMLRGINIGPHKRMKMDKLRSCLEGLGFDELEDLDATGMAVRYPRSGAQPSNSPLSWPCARLHATECQRSSALVIG